MRIAAIIDNEKVIQVVDTALYKVKEPVTMVSVDRYDVMVGDDYTGGKFYRAGVEILQDPKPMELKNKLTIIDTLMTVLGDFGHITAKKMILASELTEEETKAVVDLFKPWEAGEIITQEMVTAGVFRRYSGDLYECVQAHTTQSDWTPDVTPALWIIKSAPGIIPVWVQPTGAHDAYDIGDKVQWPEGGTVWESTISANTTVPGENLVHGYWVEVTA